MRFRRRTILIRPRIQLKLVLVFTGLSVLALLLQYLFFMSLATELAERMPSGGEYVVQALPGLSIRALVVSLAVLLPVSLAVGIAITFRVAGPVHKIEGYLRRLAQGEALETCRLRKGDELHELCAAVNAVAERMRAHGALDDCADVAGPPAGTEEPLDGPPVLRHPGRRGRAGISMIEALIVMMVLSIAMGMFATTVSSMASQRQINRESAVAAEAARVVLERMRDRPFAEVFALYNAEPADDPGGPGSAPGALFAVPGLASAKGEVVLPALMTEPVGAIEGAVDDLLGGGGGGAGGGGGGLLGGGGGGGLLGGGGGGLLGGGGGGGLVGGIVGGVGGILDDVLDPDAEPFLALREDYEDRRLGMPRDLNGDGVVDDRAHSHDYLVLPVLVRVEWQGRLGPREFRLYSQLTAMER